MRILQVCSAAWFGGGEKHLADLINGLHARGHEVFLAAPADAPLRAKVDLPAENIFTVDIFSSLDLGASRKIAALLKEKNIEIVHAHLGRDYFPVSLAAHRFPPAKFILTRHVLFTMATVNRWALANVSRVIAVSPAVKRELEERKTFASEKIVVIPNGIDLARWENVTPDDAKAFRDAHSIPLDVPLIGIVGEISELKGQEEFVFAAEMVLLQHPDAHFLVVGKDAENERSGLVKLARAFGAADRFIWLDWVEDIIPLYRALDVSVSASHSESFGLAMLEAMASGCAVVATETEGAKELLAGQALVPIGHPVKLAAAINELLDDKEKRLEAGSKNREIAQNYGMEKMIDATEKLYRGS